jgi:hypothetical protein
VALRAIGMLPVAFDPRTTSLPPLAIALPKMVADPLLDLAAPRFPLKTLFVITAFRDAGEIAPPPTSAAPAEVLASVVFPTIRLLLIVTLAASSGSGRCRPCSPG